MTKFHKDIVEFIDYPFSAASIYPNGIIHKDKIKEVLLNQFPPEIRTLDGEILFISAPYKEKLKIFAQNNNIPIVKRVDIWSLILEEFLDTEFSEEDRGSVFKILEDCGVNRDEVIRIRKSLQELMIAYNFKSMLWEWFHLGLYDLLQAYNGKLAGNNYKLNNREFKTIYWKAMELGNKGFLRE